MSRSYLDDEEEQGSVMSDDLFASDVPPSPPPGPSKLNICLFRNYRKRTVHEIVELPDSDEDEMTTKRIRRKRPAKKQLVEVSDTEEDNPSPKPKKMKMTTKNRGKRPAKKQLVEISDTEEDNPSPKPKKMKTRRTTTETNETPSTTKKRIRQRQKCTECGKMQLNIWRHMESIHGKKKNDDNVKKIVSPTGYILRKCPIVKCSTVVSRMRDHLVRTHKIANGTKKLINLLRKAKPETETLRASSSDVNMPVKKEKPSFIKKEKPLFDESILIDSDDEPLIKKEKIDIVVIESDEEIFERLKLKQIAKTSTTLLKKSDSEEDFMHSQDLYSPTQRAGSSQDLILTQKGQLQSSKPVYRDAVTQTMQDTDSDSGREVESSDEEKSRSRTPEKRIITNYQEYLYGFKTWLMNTRYKDAENAMQHCSQVKNLWKEMSPNLTMEGFLERSKFAECANKMLETKKPGTVQSYLGSCALFIQYLLDEDKLVGLILLRAIRFKDFCVSLRKSLGEKVKIRRTVVETEEVESMILPDDVSTFLRSDIARNCTNALVRRPPAEVVPSNFYNFRDFLLLRLIQSNAQRPTAVRNICVRDVQRAKITEDGGAVISVTNHKTGNLYPAIIALSPIMYTMILNFIHYCNTIPGIVKDTCRNVFFSLPKPHGGEIVPLTSSQVNKSVQRIWKMANVTKKVTATRLRKATATAVRAAVPESRDVLARHMTHSVKTSDRYYAIYNQREMAMPVTQLIATVMENEKTNMNIRNSIHWSSKSSNSDTEEYEYVESQIAQKKDNEEDKSKQMEIVNATADKEVQNQDTSGSREQSLEIQNREPQKERTDYAKGLEIIEGKQRSLPNEKQDTSGSREQSLEIQNKEPQKERTDYAKELEIIEGKQRSLPNEKQDTSGSREQSLEIQNKEPQKERIDYAKELKIYEEKQRSLPTYFSHRRRCFHPDEAKILIELCREPLKTGQLQKENIISTLQSTPKGLQFLIKMKARYPDFIKKICDRVRTEYRKRNN